MLKVMSLARYQYSADAIFEHSPDWSPATRRAELRDREPTSMIRKRSSLSLDAQRLSAFQPVVLEGARRRRTLGTCPHPVESVRTRLSAVRLTFISLGVLARTGGHSRGSRRSASYVARGAPMSAPPPIVILLPPRWSAYASQGPDLEGDLAQPRTHAAQESPTSCRRTGLSTCDAVACAARTRQTDHLLR